MREQKSGGVSEIRSGFVLAVQFAEYAELRPFLSEAAHSQFRTEYKDVFSPFASLSNFDVQIGDDGKAVLTLAETPKATPDQFVGLLNKFDVSLRTWVGTFGRTGLPPMKFASACHRRPLSGPVVQLVENTLLKICREFQVSIVATGELIRASASATSWVDIDDCLHPDDRTKVMRVFTRFGSEADRSDRFVNEDIQMLRAARKAYFLQNWEDAASKFDRLSFMPQFKNLCELYLERIQLLKSQKRIENWNGVFSLPQR